MALFSRKSPQKEIEISPETMTAFANFADDIFARLLDVKSFIYANPPLMAHLTKLVVSNARYMALGQFDEVLMALEQDKYLGPIAAQLRRALGQ